MDALESPGHMDRRTLARLALGGVLLGTVPVIGEPVIPDGDVRSTLASLQKLTANLASAYDEAGAAKVAGYVPNLRVVAARIITDRSVPADIATDAKAEYAKILTMFAEATNDLGDYPRAIRSGTMAASVAQEIGYAEVEGRAWRTVSYSHLLSERKRTARNVARRAHGAARNWPSGVGALLMESFTAADLGDKYAVFDLVTRAERAYDRLPATMWGKTGFEFGTLHPSTVKRSAGRSLFSIGMYDEAMPRLDEASEILAGTTGGNRAVVWLLQAKCLLGMGDLDGAVELASVAVAHEESRPSAWVARHVRELDRRSRDPKLTVGPFSDLVRQTNRWGYGEPTASV